MIFFITLILALPFAGLSASASGSLRCLSRLRRAALRRAFAIVTSAVADDPAKHG